MGLLRGAVGFMTFFVGFLLKKQHEAAWVYGLVLSMSATGNAALVLQADDLKQHYRVRRGPIAPPLTLKAVDGVSFSLAAGKTLAVVGESGCGKSTLARMIAMVEKPTSGTFAIDGKTIVATDRRQLRLLDDSVDRDQRYAGKYV